MVGYIILAFILYFLFRFVTGFVLPIWRSTKAVRQNIHNMQQGPSAGQPETTTSSSDEKIKAFTEKAGDYIDFEEIKENK